MKKIASDEAGETLEFLENSVIFFKEKLKPKKLNDLSDNDLSDQVSFNLSVINEGRVNLDPNSYTKIGEIYAKRFNKKSWEQRLSDLVSLGSSANIKTALAETNTENGYERLLIGKIHFKISAELIGESDFIMEYCNNTIIKMFIITQYNIDYLGQRRRICEITSDWEAGVNLIMLTILDFKRDPEIFIKERA